MLTRQTFSKNLFLLLIILASSYQQQASGQDYEQRQPSKLSQNFSPADTTGKPLLVVDGILLQGSLETIAKQINPEDIKTVNVFKGEAAIKKYGDKAQNGVIEIITKNVVQLNSNPDARLEFVFIKTETPASFPGGQEKFQQYILKNQDKIHSVYSRGDTGMRVNNAFLEVTVKFIVRSDGSLSDISASSSEQFGMDAIWFVAHGPKWIPAMYNGVPVNSWVTQIVRVPFVKYVKQETRNIKPANTAASSTISVNQLKKSSPFQLLGVSEHTEIVSYNFTIDLPNGDIVSIPNKGNSFNFYTLNQVNTATEGHMLTIDNIQVRDAGVVKKKPSRLWYITK
jgi:hypothetical protein